MLIIYHFFSFGILSEKHGQYTFKFCSPFSYFLIFFDFLQIRENRAPQSGDLDICLLKKHQTMMLHLNTRCSCLIRTMITIILCDTIVLFGEFTETNIKMSRDLGALLLINGANGHSNELVTDEKTANNRAYVTLY